jgi:lipoprotein-releasing system permease protein
MKAWPFFKYFFGYILRAKTRQRLLFIAVSGLFLSSFSLMFIQGIMSGLQHGLISRSQNINGTGVLRFPDNVTESDLTELKSFLISQKARFYTETDMEVMLKNQAFMAPAKIHGINLDDPLPDFLKDKDFSGIILGSDLAGKVKTHFMDELQVIAPGVTDSLMGEVPRFATATLSDYLYTEISEVDDFEGFVRLSFLQNLLRNRSVSGIRLFYPLSDKFSSELLRVSPKGTELRSWEEMNASLVWSLNLETKVMMFLFISMSFLVAIAITSGLLIFFGKIKRDLMSFWILGMGQEKILGLCLRFTLLLSGLTCILGVGSGQGALLFLESYGHAVMPDIFVERQFPVHFSLVNTVLSLLIPFGISLIFSWFSFAQFRKENQSFVAIVRSLN